MKFHTRVEKRFDKGPGLASEEFRSPTEDEPFDPRFDLDGKDKARILKEDSASNLLYGILLPELKTKWRKDIATAKGVKDMLYWSINEEERVGEDEIYAPREDRFEVIANAFQIFPTLRDDPRIIKYLNSFGDAEMQDLKRRFEWYQPGKAGIISNPHDLTGLRNMLEIFPDRRHEIEALLARPAVLEMVSRGLVQKEKWINETNRPAPTREKKILIFLKLAGEVSMLFPDMKPSILSLIEPYWKEIRQLIRERKTDSMEKAVDLIHAASILGSDRAWVDEQGTRHITYQDRRVGGQTAFPVRSTL